jgi:hypothetical protein
MPIATENATTRLQTFTTFSPRILMVSCLAMRQLTPTLVKAPLSAVALRPAMLVEDRTAHRMSNHIGCKAFATTYSPIF